MMKICILTSAHPCFSIRIFHKEAKALAKAGYKVVLIAQHEREEIIDGIKIIPLKKPKKRIIRMTKTVWQAYKMACKIDADIYHFHDPELIPIALLLKCHGKRVIYDVHEDVPEQILSKKYISKILRGPIAYLYNYFEKNASKTFDHIVCVTEVISNKFISYNEKTSTVRNYISKWYAENYIDNNCRLRDGVILVFTGGIYDERGILEGIKAINLISDFKIKFILYGPVDKNYHNKIIKEDKHGLVMYKGWLPYEKILQEINKADIGYLCDYPLKRHKESLPIKLFEYMAMGIPVIASNFPDWNDIIYSAECGLTVNPLDPEDIAKALRYLTENEDERRRLGENGRRAIIDKYNWETESEILLNIYNKMGENL